MYKLYEIMKDHGRHTADGAATVGKIAILFAYNIYK